MSESHELPPTVQHTPASNQQTDPTRIPGDPAAGEPSGDTTRPRDNTPADPSDTTLVRGAIPMVGLTADAPSAGAGRYRLGAELARGGMGIVFRAEDTVLGREVAVKVLAPGLAGTDAARRFVEETRITARLEHPSIPPIQDLGELPDGRPYLAMKLIRGKTLAEELRKRESNTEDLDRFIGIFEQICMAVGFAHSKGIIHRDLKPANVMVGAFNEVQVMDWGLAKEVRAKDRIDTTAPTQSGGPEDRTHTGQIMGTPAYMPPEQANGQLDRVDERADVFALGGILCAILTGKPPYTGTMGWVVLQKAQAGDLGEADTRLRNAIDGFAGRADSDGSAALVGLARRCLSPDPDHRPSGAIEVAAMLRSMRSKAQQYHREVEIGQAVSEADREAKWAKRWLRLAVGVGFVVVVLALAVAFVASRPLGDYTAMGVVFGLAFLGVLYFATITYSR